MKRIVGIFVVLLLGIFQRSSSGQQSDLLQAKGQASLQHEVSVVRKLVQVYVSDKRGNPITDLQKDDFILYDNKDEKQITEFERHALSLPGTAAPAPAAEPAVTAIEPPEPLLSRRFFMLFDLLGTAMDKQDGRSTGAAQAFIFDPKKYKPYLGNQLTAGAPITAAVRCSVPSEDVSGLELSAKLISQASGEEHAIALTILDKREDKNAKVFLARLEIPEAAKGLYRMAFIVSDGRSGLSSRIIRNFSIR